MFAQNYAMKSRPQGSSSGRSSSRRASPALLVAEEPNGDTQVIVREQRLDPGWYAASSRAGRSSRSGELALRAARTRRAAAVDELASDCRVADYGAPIRVREA